MIYHGIDLIKTIPVLFLLTHQTYTASMRAPLPLSSWWDLMIALTSVMFSSKINVRPAYNNMIQNELKFDNHKVTLQSV